MLSKALVFCFSVLGIYALFMAAMPAQIQEMGWSGTQGDVETQERFRAADLLAYKSTGSDNMTYPYSSLDDAPSPPQWVTAQSGKYMEVIWWTDFGYRVLSIRDVQLEWWGRDYHAMTLRNRAGILIGAGGGFSGRVENTEITKAILVANYESEFGAAFFSAECEHLDSSILFQYNQTAYASIGDAFDAGELGYSLTYDIDYNATGINAWNIAGQLLSFQAPDLGIGGVAGALINACIAIPIWGLIAYIVFKLIAGIIPFISGGSGD